MRTIPKGAEWQNIPIDNRPPLKGYPAPVEAPAPRPAVPPAVVEPPAEPKRRRPVAAHWVDFSGRQ